MQVVILTSSKDVKSIVQALLNSKHTVVGIIQSCVLPKKKKKVFKLLTQFKRVVKVLYKGFKSDLILFAKKKNIPYFLLTKHNKSELEPWLKELDAGLIVVRSSHHMLWSNILEIPKHGVINVHPSYLPEYRGANPMFWAYHDMELNPGVTVHYIDEGEDTGDIIYQERYSLNVGSKLDEAEKNMGKVGAKLLLRAIDDIENGTVIRVKQEESNSNYRARKIKESEIASLINWNEWPVTRVYHYLNYRDNVSKVISKSATKAIGVLWEVTGYKSIKKQRHINHKPGLIIKENEKYKLICKDGDVLIRRRFSVKRLFQDLTHLTMIVIQVQDLYNSIYLGINSLS
ncbi:methionyl-tRNA formyltransferase [Solitalea lacus]|uniref:methionyl-tRNA formyltransferase n=1 Tax=Solitalea lacus TaxID=2911172 RepID=UPI001EDAE6B2|nr:formyltransferase family protein [Solitalea lacus]UKJ07234.1 hypothetical protein L2B55_17115 [Solitalea lacus]